MFKILLIVDFSNAVDCCDRYTLVGKDMRSKKTFLEKICPSLVQFRIALYVWVEFAFLIHFLCFTLKADKIDNAVANVSYIKNKPWILLCFPVFVSCMVLTLLLLIYSFGCRLPIPLHLYLICLVWQDWAKCI